MSSASIIWGWRLSGIVTPGDLPEYTSMYEHRHGSRDY